MHCGKVHARRLVFHRCLAVFLSLFFFFFLILSACYRHITACLWWISLLGVNLDTSIHFSFICIADLNYIIGFLNFFFSSPLKLYFKSLKFSGIHCAFCFNKYNMQMSVNIINMSSHSLHKFCSNPVRFSVICSVAVWTFAKFGMSCCGRLQADIEPMFCLGYRHALQNIALVLYYIVFLAWNPDRTIGNYTYFLF